MRRLANEVISAGLAFRSGAAATAQAWPVLLGRALFYGLIMVVVSSLWDRVMAARLPGTLAATIQPGVLVLYVAATEWITLSLPSVHLRLEDDIRSGGLEPHLLRPKAYLIQTLAQTMGGAVVRLAVLAVTGLVLLGVSGRAWPAAPAFAYLAVLGPLDLTVGVLLYTLAGLAAFRARRTLRFQLVIQKLMFIAGGLFAPISLYPQPFRGWAEASPFAAHLYGTGRQALAPSLGAFGQGVAWSLFWIAALAVLCDLIWRAGLAKILRQGM
jgi:ABC-2 type transport system permease protein